MLVTGLTGWEDLDEVGWLVTPNSGDSLAKVVASGRHWACDNACFGSWSRDAFVRMLKRIAGKPRLLWVVAPDVVGDSVATLKRFHLWVPVLSHYGVPIAYVAQDGCAPKDVPWSRIACLFIGGTTAYKLGPMAAACVLEAKKRGIWVHMGRVNSLKRVAYAKSIGCDSFDGTQWSRFRSKYRHLAERAVQMPRQLPLGDIVAQ